MSVYTCIFTSVPRAGQPSLLSTIVGLKRMIQSRDAGVQFNPPIAVYNNPGQFVYPGGGVNQGENPLDAALREFREETGVNFALNQQRNQVHLNPNYNFPVRLQPMNGFSCAYIKTQTLQDLQVLTGIIQANINVNFPVSDELQGAQILQLQDYAPRVATQAIINYCNQNRVQLRTLRTLAQWRAFLNGGQIVVPSPVPTTQGGVGANCTGVLEFSQQCYDMGPFMNFIRNPNPPVIFDFPPPNRQYSFLKQNNEQLPSRFSTDWFSQISENIRAMDAIM